MLGRALGDLLRAPRRRREANARAPVALDQVLDIDEEIGPDRLRAGIAAPQPAEQRRHEEERHGRENKQAGDVIDLLRPDLDEEEIETLIREIDEHRLMRCRRTAIPADPGYEVIDGERYGHHGPFDLAVAAVDELRIDRFARLVELAVLRAVGRTCIGPCHAFGGHRSKGRSPDVRIHVGMRVHDAVSVIRRRQGCARRPQAP